MAITNISIRDPNIEEYRRLTKQHHNIADSLAMYGAEDIEFEPQRMTIEIRPAWEHGSAA